MAITHSSYNGGRFPAYMVNTADITTTGSVDSISKNMDTGATIYNIDTGEWYIVTSMMTGSAIITQYTSPISGSF